jgi:hypothetical protein
MVTYRQLLPHTGMVELSIIAPLLGREEITEFGWKGILYEYFTELLIFSGALQREFMFFDRGFCLITDWELLCMTLMHVIFCNLLFYACRLRVGITSSVAYILSINVTVLDVIILPCHHFWRYLICVPTQSNGLNIPCAFVLKIRRIGEGSVDPFCTR